MSSNREAKEREIRRKLVVDAIKTLTGTRQNSSPITQEALAEIMGVSVPTIVRWARGDTIPTDERMIGDLLELKRQKQVWYLPFAPFVLAGWSPLRGGQSHGYHGEFFTEIRFEPVSQGVRKCSVKLDHGFRGLHLMVLSPFHKRIGLSATPKGAGSRRLHFHWLRSGKETRVGKREKLPFTLRRGATMFFYLVDLI